MNEGALLFVSSFIRRRSSSDTFTLVVEPSSFPALWSYAAPLDAHPFNVALASPQTLSKVGAFTVPSIPPGVIIASPAAFASVSPTLRPPGAATTASHPVSPPQSSMSAVHTLCSVRRCTPVGRGRVTLSVEAGTGATASAGGALSAAVTNIAESLVVSPGARLSVRGAVLRVSSLRRRCSPGRDRGAAAARTVSFGGAAARGEGGGVDPAAAPDTAHSACSWSSSSERGTRRRRRPRRSGDGSGSERGSVDSDDASAASDDSWYSDLTATCSGSRLGASSRTRGSSVRSFDPFQSSSSCCSLTYRDSYDSDPHPPAAVATADMLGYKDSDYIFPLMDPYALRGGYGDHIDRFAIDGVAAPPARARAEADISTGIYPHVPLGAALVSSWPRRRHDEDHDDGCDGGEDCDLRVSRRASQGTATAPRETRVRRASSGTQPSHTAACRRFARASVPAVVLGEAVHVALSHSRAASRAPPACFPFANSFSPAAPPAPLVHARLAPHTNAMAGALAAAVAQTPHIQCSEPGAYALTCLVIGSSPQPVLRDCVPAAVDAVGLSPYYVCVDARNKSPDALVGVITRLALRGSAAQVAPPRAPVVIHVRRLALVPSTTAPSVAHTHTAVVSGSPGRRGVGVAGGPAGSRWGHVDDVMWADVCGTRNALDGPGMGHTERDRALAAPSLPGESGGGGGGGGSRRDRRAARAAERRGRTAAAAVTGLASLTTDAVSDALFAQIPRRIRAHVREGHPATPIALIIEATDDADVLRAAAWGSGSKRDAGGGFVESLDAAVASSAGGGRDGGRGDTGTHAASAVRLFDVVVDAATASSAEVVTAAATALLHRHVRVPCANPDDDDDDDDDHSDPLVQSRTPARAGAPPVSRHASPRAASAAPAPHVILPPGDLIATLGPDGPHLPPACATACLVPHAVDLRADAAPLAALAPAHLSAALSSALAEIVAVQDPPVPVATCATAEHSPPPRSHAPTDGQGGGGCFPSPTATPSRSPFAQAAPAGGPAHRPDGSPAASPCGTGAGSPFGGATATDTDDHLSPPVVQTSPAATAAPAARPALVSSRAPTASPPRHIHVGDHILLQPTSVSAAAAAALQVARAAGLTADVTVTDKVQWSDVGGLDRARRELLALLSTDTPDGLTSRVGVLLYGPPGCGKTLLAKAVATELRCAFVAVKGAEVLSMYVGESERNVRDIFARARALAPSVVFLDEIDALAPRRGRANDTSGVVDRVTAALAAEIDRCVEAAHKGTSARVCVIGATNRRDLLDTGLLRPGRFDVSVQVTPPSTPDERMDVLRALTRRFTLGDDALGAFDDAPLSLSGADLYGVCARAAMIAVKRLITSGAVDAEAPGESPTLVVQREDMVAALLEKGFVAARPAARLARSSLCDSRGSTPPPPLLDDRPSHNRGGVNEKLGHSGRSGSLSRAV